MALLLAMTVGLFVLRHTVHKKYDNPNAPLYFQMLNACIVEFLNALFSEVAKILTDRENHRTHRQYQSHLLAKCFTFKFFNSYVRTTELIASTSRISSRNASRSNS